MGIVLPRNTSAQAVSPALERVGFDPGDSHEKRLAVLRTLQVGDLVSFYVEVKRIGTTSVTVTVEVFAERRPTDPHVVKVTEATLTYVAIDAGGRPRPVPRA